MVVILFNRNLTSFSIIYDVIQSIWELQFHIQLVSGLSNCLISLHTVAGVYHELTWKRTNRTDIAACIF